MAAKRCKRRTAFKTPPQRGADQGQRDRRHDDQSPDHILRHQREAHKEHDVDQDDHEQAARERPAHGALAAQKPDPAKHRSGDRGKRQRFADQGIARPGLRSHVESGESLKIGADDVGAHAHGCDADSERYAPSALSPTAIRSIPKGVA
ncbi:MAG: hypothetical protein WCF81_04170 [Roseiarcus sp.]